MTPIRFRGPFVAGLATVTALAAGCLPAPEAGPAGSRAVSFEMSADPTSFDPSRGRAADDYDTASLLYDSLLTRDPDGNLAGALASSWRAESASRYVFTIRQGATCSDGTPITPTVVADSLNHLAGNTGVKHSFGVLAFGKGAPRIVADDVAGTVAVETAAPYTTVPFGLSTAQSGIICPAGLRDLAGLHRGTVAGALSGPYRLASARPGVSYSFERRADYRQDPDFATRLHGTAPQRFTAGLATDVSASANKLLAGDLDIAVLSGESLGRFTRSEYRQSAVDVANVYVMFNERPGHAFADNEPARRAVAQLIDRKAFNEAFSEGTGPIVNSVVPSGYRCALDDPSLIPAADPAAAARVLRGMKIEFVASNGFMDKARGAEFLFQALTAAGADVHMEKVDNATWATRTQSPGGSWDITIAGDVNSSKAISASLDRVLGPALEDGGRNIPGVRNPEGVEALRAALAAVDPAEQCRGYEQAQRSLLQRVDVVPLTTLAMRAVTPPEIRLIAPSGALSLKYTRIVKDET